MTANIDITKIKGIIFDYGGTIDSGGDHWSEVIYDAYLKAGIAVDKPLFREAYVYAERELARTLHIQPHHNFHDLLDIKMQIELQWLAQHGHFPPEKITSAGADIARICYHAARKSAMDAIPVLEQLEKRYPMVLVSNFYGNVESVLDDFGLSRFFRSIVESAVVGVRKPDPEIFRLGCKALQMQPENVLVIGDSFRKDIIPAETIGCQVLWLKGKGWTEAEDAQMHPNIIHSLDEILSLLEKA